MRDEKRQILVVDDEPNLRRVLSAQLERDGYEVHTAEDGTQAHRLLVEHHFDLVISDLRMPGLDGMQLLRLALELDPSRPVVILTAHGTVDTAVDALKLGAFDYITKPFDQGEVRSVVMKALKAAALSAREASAAGSADAAAYGLIGQSQVMEALRARVAHAAGASSPVLITGARGTGKELVAQAIHQRSSRALGPFIKLNCAALPEDAVEAELFGSLDTSAATPRPGRFELAHGGTLFIDEVGAIAPATQPKLLGALQSGDFQRVGGLGTQRADVRLISASTSDLKQEAKHGAFHADLLAQLSGIEIHLADLRDRTEDIPLLSRHFLGQANLRLGKQVQAILPELDRWLIQYPWPGNIRELENLIERAVLFCDTATLSLADLPSDLRELTQTQAPQDGSGLKEQVRAATARLERELIDRALQQTGGNVTHTARLLKISRKGLQLKMKELGLREREERTEP